jgi:hypothetical protein
MLWGSTLNIAGWIDADTPEGFRWPWRHLNASSEQYTLRYETRYLLELGRAMDYFMSIAVSYAVQQTLMETALAGECMGVHTVRQLAQVS